MKKNLFTKITATLLITSTLSSAVFTTHANAQTAASSSSSGAVGQKFANVGNGTGANGTLLANAVAGKLLLKADVGYVYGFGGDWNKSTAATGASGGNNATGAGTVGYGVSLGWTHKSGLGLSADYMGFDHKWTGDGTSGANDSLAQYNYDTKYNVVTFVPNYRLKLDKADYWGVRFGLGLGFSLSNITWAQQTGGAQNGVRVAGGAVYSGAPQCPLRKDAASDSAGQPALANTCELSGADVTDDSIASWLINVGVTSDGRQLLHIPTSIIIFTEGTNGPVAAGILSQVKKATDDARAACTAQGAAYIYTIANGACTSPSGNGSANGGTGFVIAPQVAVEYDNGLLHADVNMKYLHEVVAVRYAGSQAAPQVSSIPATNPAKDSDSIAYTSKAGPLALFIGAGLGVNF
ncbi:MAG: hypothetical protein QM529_07675 [Hydrotalea sp.]|nr:hypothetical protein [Hydrotalea sp.]